MHFFRLGSRTSYCSVHANRTRRLPNRYGSAAMKCVILFAGQLEAENRLLLLQTICVRNALVPGVTWN